MVRKWFLLSPAGSLLLSFAVGLQAFPWGGYSTAVAVGAGSRASQSSASYGLPPSIHVTRDYPGEGTAATTGVRIDWHFLVPVLLALYLASAAVGRAVTPPGRPWRPAVVLLAVVGAAMAVAFVVAIGFSRYYWGYFLSRPEPDFRVVGATRVVSLTTVHTEPGPGGALELVDDPLPVQGSVAAELLGRAGWEEEDGYYELESRVPRILRRQGVSLDAAAPLEREQLAALHARLMATGRIDPGEPGYSSAFEVDGVVMEVDGPAGEPFLFIAVTSGEVSNDHRAYYEFLFANSPGDPAQQPLSVKKFYYDVAGIEGAEWYAVMLGLSVVAVPVALSIAVLVLAVRRWREVRRTAAPGFPIAPRLSRTA